MVLLDNAPDLTQNVISLSLAELIKTKAPKEATPDENTDAAEKVKADAPEPEKGAKKNNHCRHSHWEPTTQRENGNGRPVFASWQIVHSNQR